VGSDGYPLTKAVLPAKYRESLSEIYFCTNTSSKFVADMSIKEKYWQNMFKNAYPQKSFTDPGFCVLRFSPISGRFYADFTLEDFEI